MGRFELDHGGEDADRDGNQHEIEVAILDAVGVFALEVEEEEFLNEGEEEDEIEEEVREVGEETEGGEEEEEGEDGEGLEEEGYADGVAGV